MQTLHFKAGSTYCRIANLQRRKVLHDRLVLKYLTCEENIGKVEVLFFFMCLKQTCLKIKFNRRERREMEI